MKPGKNLNDLEAEKAVLQQDGAKTLGTERRGRERNAFEAEQRIAPWESWVVSGEAAFLIVKCCDLSTTGIAFLVPTRPSFQSFVLELGARPNCIFVAAEVVHCADVLVDPDGSVKPVSDRAEVDSGNGKQTRRMVRVGARFLNRIERE